MIRSLSLPALVLLVGAGPSAAQEIVQSLDSGNPGANFGVAVRTMGDLNGDGHPDVAVGEPDWFHQFGNAAVHVYRGGDGAPLYSVTATPGTERYGTALGRVPDLDADGADELLIGAPGDPANPNAATTVELRSGATGTLMHSLTGQNGSSFGAALVGLDDLDGDGVADFATGAPTDSTFQNGAGAIYVYSGSTVSLLYVIAGQALDEALGTALASMPDQNGDGAPEILAGAPGVTNAYLFSGADGSLLRTFDGPGTARGFGFALDALGDLDGDSLVDVIIGAPFEGGHTGANHGFARVYSNATALTIHEFPGGFAGDYYGHAVAGTADIDHDGTPDFIVGGPQINSSSFYPTGFVQARSGATGSHLFYAQGAAVPASFGYAIDDLGDFDGDGVHDILVGAPGLDYASVVQTEEEFGTPFCFGDGSGGLCPCGNFNDGSVASGAAGCANGENAGGGQLVALGSASVAAGSLRLLAQGLDPDAPGLYFQGTSQVNGGAGAVFGDGLRCAGGSVTRLEVAVATSTGLSKTTGNIAALGGVGPGDTRTYQLWYRNPGSSPCSADFNLTNGVEFQWTP